MDTLLLDTQQWDLVSDLNGNIAVASNPYSQAQDAASEIRTFNGEVYYDTSYGVPYWESFLGQRPPLALIKAKLVDAALRVPGVTSARTIITQFVDRIVFGQVQITNEDGQTLPANF